ncbi:MAG: phage major capsid protein [Hyphomicrobiaceae bacterium]|nr:phage major capsid protein [Hyphomicrobiaceae bacterium]
MTASTTPAPAPETKSAATAATTAAFDEFMRTFAQFRDANDQRLSEIEARLSADVITTERVDRINSTLDEQKRVLDELALKAARPPLSGEVRPTGSGLQHKAAFDAYVRAGDVSRLRSLEQKALSVGSDPDGGYLVPTELETAVNMAVRAVSPIRAIAGIRQVSGSVYKKPFSIAGAETGWVAETAARTTTNAPTLAALTFPTMELYAMPAATTALLDDSAVNIDQWIAEEGRAAGHACRARRAGERHLRARHRRRSRPLNRQIGTSP